MAAGLAPKIKVLRDTKWSEQDASILVPGDVISIKLGDIVPADARLLDGDPLKIDQSALTGECLPVNKNASDEVFSGSTCKQGEIEAVVMATGVHTFFGKAVHLVDSTNVGHFQKMTVAFTSIIAIFIIERVDAHKGTLSIVPLLLAGVVSILYWRFFNDLRPYALVQFVPIIAIPIMAILLPPMYTHSTYWLWAAGFYLLAKVEEAADRPIYNLTHHFVSGHMLKHLCAAMVPVFLTLMLAKRDVTHERVSLIQIWRMSWTKVKENGADVESISCTYSAVPVVESYPCGE